MMGRLRCGYEQSHGPTQIGPKEHAHRAVPAGRRIGRIGQDDSLNYTFWLNIAFGLFAVALFAVVRRHPMQHGHCEHHAHQAQAHHH
jgi:hypothetical protein